ncbi:hypothetical protein VN97_g4257 [Penicillium thymicola]|uniref:Uncharacterized protein n=1 Tax=Penicillium thymicola TaxID=293382 RepID=A0AAI9XAB1_PENTH|nr:hypothetical protein VN97_g4257 [Penicillium thymicola]
MSTINQPSGRAVTRPSHLPWSSGDDFRLSLIPISAGDRGSIPRGRDFFLHFFGPRWPAGPMARRLTTNQEIAGSIPASVNLFAFLAFFLFYCWR